LIFDICGHLMHGHYIWMPYIAPFPMTLSNLKFYWCFSCRKPFQVHNILLKVTITVADGDGCFTTVYRAVTGGEKRCFGAFVYSPPHLLLFFYFSYFPFLIRFTYFLLSSIPSPFLQDLSHSVSRPEVVGGDRTWL